MNWYAELLSIGMKPDCKNCTFENCYGNGEGCGRFAPRKFDKLFNDISKHLTLTTPKLNSRKFKVNCRDYNRYGIVQDDNSLYLHYVQFINDTLDCIRKSKRNNPSYIFHLTQARDLVKYENIKLDYNSYGDCFEVRQAR